MKKDQYCIWLFILPELVHMRACEEMAMSLQAAFTALGYDVPVVHNHKDIRGRAIVLGAHLGIWMLKSLPKDLILYNVEQIEPDIEMRYPGYIDFLRMHPVWDYSPWNIQRLREFGINATYCGVGYMPVLTHIAPVYEDIDVLFVGSMNKRRQAVLDELKNQGRVVHHVYNMYGAERDAWIARAKIVINVHFYEAKILEIVRISYLLANRKCVVSESGRDEAMEVPFREGVAFVDYDKLVPTCQFLLLDARARARYADKGFEFFRAMSQVPMLEHALATA